MKQKIKKTKKIKNELTPNYSGVLLEEMNSNLKLILEDHTGLNKKIDGLDKKIDENHKEFQEFCKDVSLRFNGIDQRLDGIDGRLDGIDSNFKTVFKLLSQIDDELKSIKKQLKNKADLTFLKILEKRIKKLEINYTELHSLILQRCS